MENYEVIRSHTQSPSQKKKKKKKKKGIKILTQKKILKK